PAPRRLRRRAAGHRLRRPRRRSPALRGAVRHRPGAARLGDGRRRAQHAPRGALPRRPERRGPTTVTASAALWQAVLGNPRPVEIEIGPGRGDVLLAFAAARPDTNFFAIEHAGGLAETLAAAARARGLGNARVVAGDARCVLGLVPSASVAAVHVYFPDP